jgi:hypothetical protein
MLVDPTDQDKAENALTEDAAALDPAAKTATQPRADRKAAKQA